MKKQRKISNKTNKAIRQRYKLCKVLGVFRHLTAHKALYSNILKLY